MPMTRPLRAAWHIFALLLLLFASAANAAMPARPQGPVLDQAGIIPDAEEAALAQRLSAYNAETGRAVVVATVASLDEQDVEGYANALFRAWGIGGEKTDQGLLFLIAPNERKVRIEVGYGLEEYLPDALAGRILSGAVTPRFKEGDYAGGISAGVEQILAQLSRNPADAKAIAEAAARRGSGEEDSVIASAFFWVFIIVMFMLVFGRHGRGHVARKSGIDPGIVLWGISEIARAASDNRRSGGWGGGSDWGGGGGGFGGFGGFGGGDSGGGGASGDW